jgi:hypothetical protein
MRTVATVLIGMVVAGGAAAAEGHKIRIPMEPAGWDAVPWVIRQGPVDYADEPVPPGRRPDERVEFATMEPRKKRSSLFLDPQD